MGELKDTTIALNVRLKPSESSAHPRAANYTNVGVAQGIAYLDFGFIEPSVLATIAKATKDGQASTERLGRTPCHPCRDGSRLVSSVGAADSASAEELGSNAAAKQEAVGRENGWTRLRGGA